MEWKGRDVRSPGDYVTAMRRITTSEEADEFRARMMESGAIDRKIADRNLGYITGYMDRDEGVRVRALFAVQHPVMGELVGQLADEELFNLGAEFFRQHYVRQIDFDVAAQLAREHVLMMREVRAPTTNGDR